jgi:hypothetical protein
MRMRLSEKSLEIVFAVVFSILVFTLFFALLSMNDLVLGNDPAIHLAKAEMILASGKIPMGDYEWYTPLYHILLSSLIAFTGATSVEQMLFLMKTLTALIDWLLVFSVYLMGAKFFGKKYGVLASALLLLCFPLYEINFWGGYTGLLGLTFMCLLFLYLPLVRKEFELVLITFIAAFSVVLSHSLATFVTAAILSPYILISLLKSRGKYSRAWIAAILGGAIAFFLYYWKPVISRIDTIIVHVFFENKAAVYQIPFVSFSSFLLNFGFILFFAVFGVFFAFFKLKKEKKLSFYLILALNLFIPLLLSQSYLFGLYLDYERFPYYMLPPLAIFAAVSFSFIIDLFFASYRKIRNGRKRLMQIVTVSIVVMMCALVLFRFQTVSNKINESAFFYSTSDVNGYNAAVWLKENFPDATANVTVTEKPGSWFGIYSGKFVIAETNPVVEWNTAAESILDLSYEIAHPLTLVRGYMAKGYTSDENYVSMSGVWRRASSLSEQGVFLSFDENGVAHRFFDLSGLNREIVFDVQSYPKRLVITYFNDDVTLTESLLVHNDSYPIDVVWSVSPLRSEIENVTLYITYDFDLSFSFEQAYIPEVLDWESPWSRPSYTNGSDWAVVEFSPENVAGKYVGIYDEKNEVAFAMQFVDLPAWGNVGVLGSRQIDAIRFEYQFDKVKVNQPASLTYRVLTFSRTSFPDMQQLGELENMFDSNVTSGFVVSSRSYADYIREFGIKFLVYDKSRFDIKLLNCDLLQLVYSNDGYVICRVKSNP